MNTTSQAGTGFHAIVKELNKNQSWRYEVGVFTSQTQWLNWAKLSLRNYKPIIIDINSYGSNWPYATAGHYMVVSGLNLDYQGASPSDINLQAIVQTVKINDPYRSGEGIKWHPFSRIYGMNYQHKDNAIIY
ncbi:hypothetical protein GX865_04405 [Candidatus Saccharibacteria bacterium]|nr:hypothetical protein [Candidatus Saccharibacteria bacterium]